MSNISSSLVFGLGKETIRPKIAIELRKIQKRMETDLNVWSLVHSLIGKANLKGGDAILFQYPIKSPFFEIYDNIGKIANYIEKESNP